MKWQVLKPTKANYYLPVEGNLGLVILAKSGKSEIIIDLDKEGKHALILGLVDSDQQDNLELIVTTIHNAPNTHAETMIYGLVRDRAQVQIKGLIQIKKQAQRVTDFLTERILLLSDQSRAIAEPELEIEADEVRASHAATVASIDKDERFYLMSRGVTGVQAEQLIVSGFINQVINRIDDVKIRQQVCLMLKK
ncbi:hypothetical protein COW80_02250 [Candidatus Beckwithbacteria bacterium CG22_combo_CG10-13_8_21_14_all_01_47_9]|uniref:SUF system FeS cluster assembly SufBD core domain-containing protein n=4 Tax=Candidatus Beckwithiibacteriota TaxID=1752726 RepID=A0A2H0E0Y5_9BACT|nr:MAG: hypothetical protein AUJ59_01360 [Candidatus Beckwithbacteria bacterium CG1_02_47_37]PIP88084.1 MAG: hypothetical protein COW80_02250 [Candidatus Beckwithbacteria bacterium CG22_combo_CG10-13_8_21_14_all_01_47_9]PJA23239.1 MAG: hypothetical protein COX59_00915 [Candidatus Beckwithbacteria bacterium CG_4_10_14_0_2_um_filter_47_25]PJC66776.1 MAG: hypothetical protein CO018_00270 [Candidatus Beckwithbacteria bacterium CG_4_9_14_0_2_um_filter_47_11]